MRRLGSREVALLARMARLHVDEPGYASLAVDDPQLVATDERSVGELSEPELREQADFHDGKVAEALGELERRGITI